LVLWHVSLFRELAFGCEAYLVGMPQGRVLDVGCGDGKTLAIMRDLGWQVFGVEPDLEAARAARKAYGIEVFAGDLDAANLESESFDAVLLHHVIEHVQDPQALLVQCRRLLRKGGRLVIMTPNLAGLGHRVFGRAWFALDPPRHLVLFTSGALKQMAQRSGLRVVKTKTSAHMAVATFLGSWMIRWTGSYDMSSGGCGLLLPTLAGIFFHAVEHALSAFSEQGDDVVMVAQL
jgi:2-polyprenyl-3-methyl-5-hydroxy-6-metoxy-1,4-benzoquinol methylase